jgi:hypothetical protein
MTMADVKAMNKGVQILLERMSSNPDEFIPDIHGRYPTKWKDMLMGIQMRASKDKDYKDQLPFLNDWEIEALWRKMHEIQGELFVKQVMNILLQDADANSKELSFFSSQPKSASLGGTVTISPAINSMRTAIGKLRYP